MKRKTRTTITSLATLALVPAVLATNVGAAQSTKSAPAPKFSWQTPGRDYANYRPDKDLSASRTNLRTTDNSQGLPVITLPSLRNKKQLGGAPMRSTANARETSPDVWQPTLKSAGTTDMVVTRCKVRYSLQTSGPGTTYSDFNNFAIAKTAEWGAPSSLMTGAMQAGVSVNGAANRTVSSPQAFTEWGFGFSWPSTYPKNSWVIAKTQPQWKGGIAVDSKLSPQLSSSTASGIFRAMHTWYDLDLNTYMDGGPVTLMQRELSKSDGTEGKDVWVRNDYTVPKDTLGIDLTPGRKFAYYQFAQGLVTVDAQFGAPGAAVLDFGSRLLDSHANIYKDDGVTPIDGRYLPGTTGGLTLQSDTIVMEFHIPGKTLTC
jgi:hypothetical protein